LEALAAAATERAPHINLDIGPTVVEEDEFVAAGGAWLADDLEKLGVAVRRHGGRPGYGEPFQDFSASELRLTPFGFAFVQTLRNGGTQTSSEVSVRPR
jgi:hypothetical protein